MSLLTLFTKVHTFVLCLTRSLSVQQVTTPEIDEMIPKKKKKWQRRFRLQNTGLTDWLPLRCPSGLWRPFHWGEFSAFHVPTTREVTGLFSTLWPAKSSGSNGPKKSPRAQLLLAATTLTPCLKVGSRRCGSTPLHPPDFTPPLQFTLSAANQRHPTGVTITR
jgi:hypothetical protein